MKVINTSSVKHRSPFRYPGGKTWLIPTAREWLRSGCKDLTEPFAGGASVSLSMLFDGLAERITLVELDPDIAAVWKCIVRCGPALADKIVSFKVSERAVRNVLAADNRRNILNRAFATILRNRMQHGGIMCGGAGLMKGGENGRGLLSRWYPDTLATRITEIADRRKQITVVQGDGIAFMQTVRSATYLIDPPYVVAAHRLYAHWNVDPTSVFEAASALKGDWLMTYDNVAPIHRLVKTFNFDARPIAMKNTHHAIVRELLIKP